MRDLSDRYRPRIHFSPPENWMNDPNGLVYHEGVYHLFYQYHPNSTSWGQMHWGHAVSPDLIHWEDRPIALYPHPTLGMAFSGSAVVDEGNTSGLFPDSPGIVLIYTSAAKSGDGTEIQSQSIAYSRDDGKTWQSCPGNPVIPNPGSPDFRDPKVLWHGESGKWILVLAHGKEVQFYGSPDLIHWDYLSSFGAGRGNQSGIWECPDLFPLSVEGAEEQRWILSVGIGDGCEVDCGGTQYFVGIFTGREFIPDEEAHIIRMADFGRDFYAAQSWFMGQPSRDRRVWIAWMSQWVYAGVTPTETWRGVMSIPRELSLVRHGADVVLRQKPVSELISLRLPARELKNDRVISLRSDTAYEINLGEEFFLSGTHRFTFRFGRNGDLKITLFSDEGSVEIDRRGVCRDNFSSCFATVKRTSLFPGCEFPAGGTVIIDSCSVEFFAQQGLVVLSDLIFPSGPLTELEVDSSAFPRSRQSLSIFPLKTIWDSSSPESPAAGNRETFQE